MSEGRWDVYVRDMVDCCERIVDYSAGLDRAEVEGAGLVHDAMLWNIAVLGEAANNVPQAVQQAHAEIPWADIIGMRNRIVHGYGAIDDNRVWEVVREDIPELIPLLRALLDEQDEREQP